MFLCMCLAAFQGNGFIGQCFAVLALQDGFAQLGPLQGDSLRGRIRIQFVDEFGVEEAGVDGGGLFKDFLECLVGATGPKGAKPI